LDSCKNGTMKRWSLLLLPLLILIALWLTAPWWLKSVLEDQLADKGFVNITVEISTVSLSSSQLDRLQFERSHGGNRFHLSTITIDYALLELLNGRVDSLDIEALDIAIPPSGEAAESGTMLLASPALLLAQLPFSQASIRNLSLRRLDAQGNTLLQATGRGDYRDGSLQLSLSQTDSEQGLRAAMMINRHGDCSLQLTRAEARLLDGRCNISESTESISMDGSLHADLDGLDELSKVWVETSTHQLRGSIDIAWQAKAPLHSNSQQLLNQLQLSARASADAVMERAEDPFALQVGGSLEFRDGSGHWRLDDHSQLSLGDKRSASIMVSRGSGQWLPNADNASHVLSIDAGSRFRIEQLPLSTFQIDQLSFELNKPVEISLDRSQSVRLQKPAEMRLSDAVIRQQNRRIAIGEASLELRPGLLNSPAGKLMLKEVNLKLDTRHLPPARLTADFDFSHEPLTAHGNLQIGQAIQLAWEMRHQAEQATGKLTYTLAKLQLARGAPELIRAFALGDKPGDELGFSHGSLAGRGKVSWQAGKDATISSHFNLRGIDGHHNEIQFTELDADLDLAADGKSLTLTSPNLTAATLNAGIPLHSLHSEITMRRSLQNDTTRLQLRNLRAGSMGGIIASNAIDIVPGRAHNPFTVSLTDIDAAEVAAFRRQEGLTITGKLNGTLPFDWTPQGLVMHTGIITASELGGIIRYLGTESMQQLSLTNPGMKLAMQVLQNFRYRILGIQADYQPDGELKLGIKLKGHSPDYDNGRPIEFNLNIEENVLKLLQSLRMADEISREVEEKVRSKQPGAQ